MKQLLEFYIDGKPVGYFRGRSYPTGPGRYLYDPYRGPGHAILVNTLRDGNPAACYFLRRRRRIALHVVSEEVVPHSSQNDWFLLVSRVGDD